MLSDRTVIANGEAQAGYSPRPLLGISEALVISADGKRALPREPCTDTQEACTDTQEAMKNPKPSYEIEGTECVVTGIATNLSGVERGRWTFRIPAAAVHESRGQAASLLKAGLGQAAVQMAVFLAEEATRAAP